MSHLERDGIRLYFEQAGSGDPLVFVHEMAGDAASWSPQMSALSRRYRCVAFNARGYPPSDVPDEPEAYSQIEAAEDIRRVLDALEIESAHVVGLSMGAFATLHFALRHRQRVRSLVLAGCGHGSARADGAQFRDDALRLAARIDAEGMAAVALDYALNATRVQFQAKDPRGWARWRDRFAQHSAAGSASTLREVQAKRPSLLDLEESIRELERPALLVVGDEDDPAIEVTLWLKRTLPAAGLLVVPRTGHTVNLEEPAWFNAALRDFLWRVEGGAWPPRDPRTRAASTMFPEEG